MMHLVQWLFESGLHAPLQPFRVTILVQLPAVIRKDGKSSGEHGRGVGCCDLLLRLRIDIKLFLNGSMFWCLVILISTESSVSICVEKTPCKMIEANRSFWI
uniref:Uncharacterized protein n=1 Tax=Clytia hemisphaerica TaxID=252671 RepID=A0A7M5X9M2_9CNID